MCGSNYSTAMRWKALIVLTAITVSTVVPPSLQLVIVNDREAIIGVLL
jgi:hypothetical protein